jgi:small subunit ribosomal protein S9
VPVVEDAFEPLPAVSSHMPVTIITILVNNVLLNKFFATPANHKHVMHLLKLTSVLSAFNIYAIVQGGSITG